MVREGALNLRLRCFQAMQHVTSAVSPSSAEAEGSQRVDTPLHACAYVMSACLRRFGGALVRDRWQPTEGSGMLSSSCSAAAPRVALAL